MRMSLPELSQHEKTAQLEAAAVPKEHFGIGPTFLTPSTASPCELCGLLDSEREWMEAFALEESLGVSLLLKGEGN